MSSYSVTPAAIPTPGDVLPDGTVIPPEDGQTYCYVNPNPNGPPIVTCVNLPEDDASTPDDDPSTPSVPTTSGGRNYTSEIPGGSIVSNENEETHNDESTDNAGSTGGNCDHLQSQIDANAASIQANSDEIDHLHSEMDSHTHSTSDIPHTHSASHSHTVNIGDHYHSLNTAHNNTYGATNAWATLSTQTQNNSNTGGAQ